jgi:hypothetical protein
MVLHVVTLMHGVGRGKRGGGERSAAPSRTCMQVVGGFMADTRHRRGQDVIIDFDGFCRVEPAMNLALFPYKPLARLAAAHLAARRCVHLW